jgi:hypothetical protein
MLMPDGVRRSFESILASFLAFSSMLALDPMRVRSSSSFLRAWNDIFEYILYRQIDLLVPAMISY